MTTDKDRAEFEAAYAEISARSPLWFNLTKYSTGDHAGEYIYKEAQLAFVAWQASAARSGAAPAVTDELIEVACIAYEGSRNYAAIRESQAGAGLRDAMADVVRNVLLAAAPEPRQGDVIPANTICPGCGMLVFGTADTPRSGDAPVAWAIRGKGCTQFVFRTLAEAENEAKAYHDKSWIEVVPLYTDPPADARDAEMTRIAAMLRDAIKSGNFKGIDWKSTNNAIDSAMGAGGGE